jgi:hypothetical protein
MLQAGGFKEFQRRVEEQVLVLAILETEGLSHPAIGWGHCTAPGSPHGYRTDLDGFASHNSFIFTKTLPPDRGAYPPQAR